LLQYVDASLLLDDSPIVIANAVCAVLTERVKFVLMMLEEVHAHKNISSIKKGAS
jgi:hypothetical protein